MTDPLNGQFYYRYDGLGSVRSLSDDKGSTKAIYFYDAFGQVQKKMESVDNDFLFAGEQMDDTGLVYLRARYYDPSVGRFITRDPFPAIGIRTQDINRYVYTMNNPVNLIDRNGRWAIWDDVLVSGVGAVGGFANLYISDVMGNIDAGKTGWNVLTPTSDWKVYAASTVGGAATAELNYIVPVGGAFVGSSVTNLAKDWAAGEQLNVGNALLTGTTDATTAGLLNRFPEVPGRWPNFGTTAFWFGKHTQNLLIQEAIGAGANVIHESLLSIYSIYSSPPNYGGMSCGYNSIEAK